MFARGRSVSLKEDYSRDADSKLTDTGESVTCWRYVTFMWEMCVKLSAPGTRDVPWFLHSSSSTSWYL